MQACDEITAGRLHDQFVVDMIQGGAGTSTNMNVNEVIANRGLEILGHAQGEYAFLHPNDDVNGSQSTNDAYPTALKLGVFLASRDTLAALARARGGAARKGERVRARHQDGPHAAPGRRADDARPGVRAYATMVEQARGHIDDAARGAARRLARRDGDRHRDQQPARLCDARRPSAWPRSAAFPCGSPSDLVEATQDSGAFVEFSAR